MPEGFNACGSVHLHQQNVKPLDVLLMCPSFLAIVNHFYRKVVQLYFSVKEFLISAHLANLKSS